MEGTVAVRRVGRHSVLVAAPGSSEWHCHNVTCTWKKGLCFAHVAERWDNQKKHSRGWAGRVSEESKQARWKEDCNRERFLGIISCKFVLWPFPEVCQNPFLSIALYEGRGENQNTLFAQSGPSPHSSHRHHVLMPHTQGDHSTGSGHRRDWPDHVGCSNLGWPSKKVYTSLSPRHREDSSTPSHPPGAWHSRTWRDKAMTSLYLKWDCLRAQVLCARVCLYAYTRLRMQTHLRCIAGVCTHLCTNWVTRGTQGSHSSGQTPPAFLPHPFPCPLAQQHHRRAIQLHLNPSLYVFQFSSRCSPPAPAVGPQQSRGCLGTVLSHGVKSCLHQRQQLLINFQSWNLWHKLLKLWFKSTKWQR